MPELPEVETTVAGLRAVLNDVTIKRAQANRADLRWPMPLDLRQRLTGARVTGLSRRAKYGLIYTDRDDVLIFHLGMSGRWMIDRGEDGKHDHFVIETTDGRLAVLNDPRRFGSLDLVQASALEQFKAFIGMGPEPLSDGFDASVLAKAI